MKGVRTYRGAWSISACAVGIAVVLAVTVVLGGWPFQTASPGEKFPVRPANSLVLGRLHLSAAMRLGEAGVRGASNFFKAAGDLVNEGECRAFDIKELLMACHGEGAFATFLEIYPEREPGRHYLSPAELFSSRDAKAAVP
jgi:hypothetical protein